METMNLTSGDWMIKISMSAKRSSWSSTISMFIFDFDRQAFSRRLGRNLYLAPTPVQAYIICYLRQLETRGMDIWVPTRYIYRYTATDAVGSLFLFASRSLSTNEYCQWLKLENHSPFHCFNNKLSESTWLIGHTVQGPWIQSLRYNWTDGDCSGRAGADVTSQAPW